MWIKIVGNWCVALTACWWLFILPGFMTGRLVWKVGKIFSYNISKNINKYDTQFREWVHSEWDVCGAFHMVIEFMLHIACWLELWDMIINKQLSLHENGMQMDGFLWSLVFDVSSCIIRLIKSHSLWWWTMWCSGNFNYSNGTLIGAFNAPFCW